MKPDASAAHILDQLSQCSGGLLSVLDGEGRVLYASGNHATLLGRMPEGMSNRFDRQWVHPEDMDRVLAFFHARATGLDAGCIDYRLLAADGHIVWARTHVGAVREADGEVRVYALTQDVTEHLRAEEALRDSQEKYRLLAEGASDVLWIMGPDLKTRYMSPAVQGQLGYTAEEYLAMSMEDRLPPESVEKVQRIFRAEYQRAVELAKEQKPHAFTMEMLHRHKDGRMAWGEVRAAFMYDPSWTIVGLHGVTRNIDDRKKAQEALAQSEEYYRRLFHEIRSGLSVGQIVRDGEGRAVDFRYVEVNPAYATVTGLPVDAVVGRLGSEVLPPAAFAGGMANVPESLAGKTIREVQSIPPDGRILEVNRWAVPGDRIVAMVDNVTERRKTEEALAASERHYRRLFDENRLGLAVCEVLRDDAGRPVDARYVEVNRGYQAHTGLAPEAVVGRLASELFAPADVAHGLLILDQVFAGETFREETRVEALGQWFDSTTWALSSDRYVVMVENVTSRRRMEEEVVRSQKLESVGLLAGGIAHDFNNILTGILGNISLVRMLTDQDPRLQPLLESAEEACGRARDLTQQLLTFSRGGDPVKADLPLPDVLRKSADFVLAGSNVSCTYRLAPSGLTAPMDRGQIAQVVQNLVINAVQAMPEGGHLEISADRVDLSEGSVPTLPAGPYVRFAVKDSGHGIEARHLDKLFDPYFTTRPNGQGLGLPVSFSIVRKHGGSITVDSAPGRGSTFTVYLPAGRLAGRGPRVGEDLQPAPRRGRVLVMDDDASVREVMGRMLTLLGYEAASVRDGTEAVQMYQRHLQQGVRFDLVLMDLTVPGGMGGKAAVREILALDPAARAIVMSGYSNDPVMADHRAYGFRGVLPKPVKMPDLRDALARLLAETD